MTMNEVIATALVDREAMVARLRTVAAFHVDAAATMRDRTARRVADGMAVEALGMADAILRWRFDPKYLGFSERIIAFTAACKVLGIPARLMGEIAGSEA